MIKNYIHDYKTIFLVTGSHAAVCEILWIWYFNSVQRLRYITGFGCGRKIMSDYPVVSDGLIYDTIRITDNLEFLIFNANNTLTTALRY